MSIKKGSKHFCQYLNLAGIEGMRNICERELVPTFSGKPMPIRTGVKLQITSFNLNLAGT